MIVFFLSKKRLFGLQKVISVIDSLVLLHVHGSAPNEI
jgi:hypothetical protein